MSRLVAKSKFNPAESFIRQDTNEKLILEEKIPESKKKDKLIELYRSQIRDEVRAEIEKELEEELKEVNKEISVLEPIAFPSTSVHERAIKQLHERYNSTEKIIFLFNRKARNKEVREIKKHFRLLGFDASRNGHVGKKINELQFEAMHIPFHTRRGRLFYSSVRKAVIEDPKIHVIFVSNGRPSHAEIKKVTGCDYIKKRLPVDTGNSAVYKILLFSDHVHKIANACLPIFKKFIK